jgi:hypothetical protein
MLVSEGDIARKGAEAQRENIIAAGQTQIRLPKLHFGLPRRRSGNIRFSKIGCGLNEGISRS